MGACVCVFVQACMPGARSALQGGVQATRWRSHNTVGPFPTDLSTCGLPEGHDILPTNHNTQTNPFKTLLCLLQLNRKHTALLQAQRASLKHAPFKCYFLCLFHCYFWFPPAQVSQCSPAFERFFFSPPDRTNTDKQPAGKHPEGCYAQ